MTPDLANNVKVAYKKLKQMVHFEKNPLTLRRRLAEFECDNNLEDRLAAVAEVLDCEAPHETSQFIKWLDDIGFVAIPKSVDRPKEHDESQGSFLTNVTSEPMHTVSRVNYMFNGPVELHLLSVLWLMTEGQEYDKQLSAHCSGSRLHPFIGAPDDHSAYLFKKYHELYAKWQDTGIQKAKELLSTDMQSVCIIGLDIKEFFYRVQIDWEYLCNQIERPEPSGPLEEFLWDRQVRGKKLFKCIESICKSYHKILSPVLAITHPDLPETATCLPIGLCASPVIANWYLKGFDDAIFEKVRPAYYGRYVDDILMVVPMAKSPDKFDPINSFMQQVLVTTRILKWESNHARYELCSRPGLYLQKNKCVLQFFDSEHSIAGLDKFQKKIEANASDFALLPVDGDDSPVAQVAYDLLYDGSVNKFRSVKAVAENRWELASHLAKQTQLHLMSEDVVDTALVEELFRFFKGSNAIEFWDMWERVISFLLVAGDTKSADLFKEAIWSEITKVKYSISPSAIENNKQITYLLRQTLKAHLDLCIELCSAVTNATKNNDDASTRIWRESNLIRHHLVAVPLLNYTDYDGNLAAPVDGASLDINPTMASNSPRFVHFDECLGFVNSGCAKSTNKDRITRANEIYELFHGSKLGDVTSELIGEEASE